MSGVKKKEVDKQGVGYFLFPIYYGIVKGGLLLKETFDRKQMD